MTNELAQPKVINTQTLITSNFHMLQQLLNDYLSRDLDSIDGRVTSDTLRLIEMSVGFSKILSLDISNID